MEKLKSVVIRARLGDSNNPGATPTSQKQHKHNYKGSPVDQAETQTQGILIIQCNPEHVIGNRGA